MEMIGALIFIFFAIRLVSLTALPIFNDEAIYLDWGWRALFTTHNLFYSLYDAKPPLVLWLFGVSEMFFSSQLFAGRFISVLFGLGTLLGIITIGKSFFSKKVGILAGIFYIVIPLFSFFDRQALLESALCFSNIWILFFSLKFVEKPRLRWIIGVAFMGSIGLYVKTSSAIYLVLAVLVVGGLLIKQKRYKNMVISLSIFLCIVCFLLFPMMMQNEYWSSLSSNSRYVLSIAELLHFPFRTWITNSFIASGIILIQLTPGIVIAAIVGICTLCKSRRNTTMILLLWFFVGILFTVGVYRSVIERYLVSTLPEVSIFAALGTMSLIQRFRRFTLGVLLIVILVPFIMTLVQVVDPTHYLLVLGKTGGPGLQEYIVGVTSGYGISETITYLKKEIGGRQSVVGFAENTGNPESAITIFFHRHPTIQAGYFDSRLISVDLSSYQCINSSIPIYFVSREDQRAGLERFLVLQKRISNPYSTNTIGIYSLQSPCVGKTLNLRIQKI